MSDTVPAHLAHWKDVPWDDRFEIWAYPMAVIVDRYGGTYSGGRWIAIAGLSAGGQGSEALKLLNCEPDTPTASPWGDDGQAGDFWADPPKWIAVGDTPDAAIAALKAKNADVNWPF